MRTGRAARSISSPRARQLVEARPPTFSADTIGGTCSMSPTNAHAAASSCARVIGHLGAFEHRARRVERVGCDAEHDVPTVRLARLLQDSATDA